MKKIMSFYESNKMAIRVAYFAFGLLAIGFLIKNDNVNIFYTFKSPAVLMLADFAYIVGQALILNLPLVFMINGVTKRANNAISVIIAILGYFAFMTMLVMFGGQNLPAQAYSNSTGVNSFFSFSGLNRYPLETGLLGSLIVALCTRLSFVLSRNRSSYSLFGFLQKDSSAIVYNLILCGLSGVFVAFIYPYAYSLIQMVVTYVARDLMDPFRIGVYGFFDRFLSMLSLGNTIRYPFWFTAQGGSFSNALTGQIFLGDVNIWKYISEASTTFAGCGRFITPYYVINIFVVPAIYLGMMFNMSDRQERLHYVPILVLGILLSVVCGNPMPLELLMLCTSPLLLLMYLIVVAIIFGVLVKFNIFLGFKMISPNIVTALPGSFPDFIINLRNVSLIRNIRGIAIVGIISFIVMFALTMLYYRVLTLNVTTTSENEFFIDRILKSVGGIENITFAGSGMFRLNVYLKDSEAISLEEVQKLGVKRISETKEGLAMEFGTSSYMIAKVIEERIAKYQLINKTEE